MEDRETRLRRLGLRSRRRGIREMDLILGSFAAGDLAALSDPELDLYERLLEESDHDVYAWVAGATEAPPPYRGLVARIAARPVRSA